MKTTKKLWIALTLIVETCLAVLLFFGSRIYQQAPPIPEKVVSADGSVLFTGEDIKAGQNVWQSMGGQETGTIWGHGAYVAPDWNADWLHREAQFILDKWSEKQYQKPFADLAPEQKVSLEFALKQELRKNTYNPDTKELVLSEIQADAYEYLKNYYSGLFSDDPKLKDTRIAYAIPENAIKTKERLTQVSQFFFWSSWACVAERPGENVSYTHNFPHDKQIGNEPTGDLMLWTGFSVIMLLLGIGVLVFFHVKSKEEEIFSSEDDPTRNQVITPSMKAVKKYFWIVGLLFLIQVGLGAITTHYGVEGNGFYGLPLDKILPYSISRTWHVQISIFWIATAWLATGLYIAPSLSGKDPKFQKLGVNVLFIALLIVVAGSLAGQWFGVMQKLGLIENFWFGHQGYEYVDLGRFWQLLLFIGLLLWLLLMCRAVIPAIRKKTHERSLLILFIISCTAIALFYAAGLMWGRTTHLSMAEYWRWWVVHLWVEGFFEVFATVVTAFLFIRMKLLDVRTTTVNVIFATIIFLSGGILGTFHHLYFTGTSQAVMAIGATFSALEVVPLTLMGFEAFHNYKVGTSASWLKEYKMPIYFLLSVSFWNFLGAGIFGFLINPPIALYYMQGLNTTAVHAHAAMFGVYGMLGIGLMLFVLRGLFRNVTWDEKLLKFSFWTLNAGVILMIVLSLLPVGFAQTVAAVNHGTWYARSAEFLNSPMIHTFKWLRFIGDVVFAAGTVSLVWFLFKLAKLKQ